MENKEYIAYMVFYISSRGPGLRSLALDMPTIRGLRMCRSEVIINLLMRKQVKCTQGAGYTPLFISWSVMRFIYAYELVQMSADDETTGKNKERSLMCIMGATKEKMRPAMKIQVLIRGVYFARQKGVRGSDN